LRPEPPGRPDGVLLARALAVGVVLLAAAAIALVALGRDQVRLTGTNSVRPDAFVVTLERGHSACQTNLLLPTGSAGVRVMVGTFGRPGPRLEAILEDPRGRVLRRAAASGYADGSRALLPFAPVEGTSRGDTLCVRAAGGRVALAGTPDPNADNLSALRVGRRPAQADLSLQFARGGRESLLSLAPTIFHRASLFRPGWTGPWTYYVLVLLAVALVLAAATVLVFHGRALAAVRTGALVVAAIAFGNGLVWSLVTPAFQPPDEVAHYAYVESIVERGELPSTSLTGGEGSYTLGTALAVDRTAVGVVQNVFGRPAWTSLEEREWKSADAALGSRRDDGGGGYTTVSSYSPVYYGLEVVPYVAGRGSDVFTRLWLMRLMSALMIAGAAFFSYLFAREIAPSVSWVAPVAGLAVALHPMLGFMGGAVNNDALVILLASAELYLLARALRVGLSTGLAVAIGAVLGVGIIAKPSMFALAPVVVVVLAWVLWRGKASRQAVLRLGGAALAAVALTLAVRYALFSRQEAIAGTFDETATSRPFSLRDFLSYVWQWYLPPLPFMNDRFAGAPPVYDVYLKGFWANFGHLDTEFAPWVYRMLAAATAGAVALGAVTLYRWRSSLTRVWPRITLAALAVVGFALLVNLRSYLALIQMNAPFAQGRYLLPAIAAFGLLVAGAALAFGRRWGSVAGAAFVTAIGCLDLFSLGLVLTRFYT
jgi:hypothetical protein